MGSISIDTVNGIRNLANENEEIMEDLLGKGCSKKDYRKIKALAMDMPERARNILSMEQFFAIKDYSEFRQGGSDSIQLPFIENPLDEDISTPVEEVRTHSKYTTERSEMSKYIVKSVEEDEMSFTDIAKAIRAEVASEKVKGNSYTMWKTLRHDKTRVNQNDVTIKLNEIPDRHQVRTIYRAARWEYGNFSK